MFHHFHINCYNFVTVLGLPPKFPNFYPLHNCTMNFVQRNLNLVQFAWCLLIYSVTCHQHSIIKYVYLWTSHLFWVFCHSITFGSNFLFSFLHYMIVYSVSASHFGCYMRNIYFSTLLLFCELCHLGD